MHLDRNLSNKRILCDQTLQAGNVIKIKETYKDTILILLLNMYFFINEQVMNLLIQADNRKLIISQAIALPTHSSQARGKKLF